jgi:hypothetical protein
MQYYVIEVATPSPHALPSHFVPWQGITDKLHASYGIMHGDSA